jgi:hypothetical protein
VDDRTYSISEFCVAEHISRTQLYDDWKADRGPRFYWNGKHRRISHEARIEWRRRREAEAAALLAALSDDKAA